MMWTVKIWYPSGYCRIEEGFLDVMQCREFITECLECGIPPKRWAIIAPDGSTLEMNEL